MGFLKKAVKGVGNFAKKALPAVAPALSFVPGIGGITSSAISFAANKTAKKSTPPSAPAYMPPAPPNMAYAPHIQPKPSAATPAQQQQAMAKGKQDPKQEPKAEEEPKKSFMDKAKAFLKKNWIWVLAGLLTSVVAVVLIKRAGGGKKTSEARVNAARRARAAKAAKARQTKKR